ncbi:hypothetical protein NP493_414g02009 [Ridgeia piscesae]|uniref:Neurotransmitter-gated ion-channel ligand-binding domain-containing protein n=1 Tax=Ridgeia piscesae TaxID=27915 RepID=A0AAD9L0E0_RIDPI|nr:hypothetical protein NP493_414g02009 [Ridgeia piscesae]
MQQSRLTVKPAVRNLLTLLERIDESIWSTSVEYVARVRLDIMLCPVGRGNLAQWTTRLAVIASCLVGVWSKADTVNEEGRLLSDLVKHYNRHARPISNVFSSINVSISFYITKILGLVSETARAFSNGTHGGRTVSVYECKRRTVNVREYRLAEQVFCDWEVQ